MLKEYFIYFKDNGHFIQVLAPDVKEVKRYISKCYPKLSIKKIESIKKDK
jgi:hypothetical protein